jgi:hypothetical protein
MFSSPATPKSGGLPKLPIALVVLQLAVVVIAVVLEVNDFISRNALTVMLMIMSVGTTIWVLRSLRDEFANQPLGSEMMAKLAVTVAGPIVLLFVMMNWIPNPAVAGWFFVRMLVFRTRAPKNRSSADMNAATGQWLSDRDVRS